jgi:PAS domain S-box-containing protein
MRESENHYRSLFKNSVDGMLLAASDGTIFAANPAACRMLGRTQEELCAVGRDGVIDPADPKLQAALAERTRTGRFARELTLIRKDGTKFPAEVTTSEFKDRCGREWTSVIMRDITERKRAEEVLRESEGRFRRITENMLDMIVQTDLQGICEYASPSFKTVLGYDPKYMLGRSLFELVHPNDLDKALEIILKALATSSAATFEYRYKHADGHYVWLESVGNPLFDKTGQITGTVLATRDITERKRLEDELKQASLQLEELVAERTGELRGSEEKYRALFEACPISLWEEDYSAVKQFLDELRQKGVSDFNAYFASHPKDIAKCAGLVKVVNVNQATLDLYGANSVDEIVGGLSGVFTEESNRQFVDEIVALAQGKKHYEAEFENKSLRGEVKPCNLICSVVSGYEESLAKVLVCLVDLTSQKLLEEENRKLASGVTMRLLEVTDQVNSLGKLRERLKTSPDVTSGLDVILEAALWDFSLDFGAILTVDSEANRLKVRASKGREREIRLEDSYSTEGFVELKDLGSEGVTRIVGEGDRSIFNAAMEHIIPILSGKGLFGVMVFGKMARDSGEVISMRILKMYADLVYSFVLEKSVTITPVLETVRTGNRTIDSGQVYLVMNNPTKAFDVFVELVFSGYEGLCITRTHPPQIRSKYHLEKTPIIWLTSEAAGNERSVRSIPDLSIMIGEFLGKAEKPVILFEGFEYLILNDGFKYFIQFLQNIKDRIQRANGILMAPLSEQTLDPKELAILKVETTIFTEEASGTRERNLKPKGEFPPA